MTLVLSVVTHDCAFQVADRRLCRWPDGRVEEDDANKLVFFDGRVAFGYTGLAQLQGKPTDRWLTQVLSRTECSGLPNALRMIADEAMKAVARVDSRIRRLAFVGVGWSLEKDNTIRPLICRVSNFHAENGEVLKSSSDRFTVHVRFLSHDERFCFLPTGQSIPDRLSDLFTTRMRQFIKKGKSRELALGLMVKVVRGTAARNNNVGLNLLSVCLPRACVRTDAERWIELTTGGPADDNATFQYWPSDLWNGVSHGPNFVIPGNVALVGFESGPLTNDGTRHVMERLGGLETHDGKPSRIVFPCCLLFDSLTDCFVSVSQGGGPDRLALFTDEDAVQACIRSVPNQLVRVMVTSRDELCRHLESVKQVDSVALNPKSPHSKGCLTTSIRGLLLALRSARI